MKIFFRNQSKHLLKTAGLNLMVFALYYVTASLGLVLATLNRQASIIWPASGLALGLVYVLGFEVGFGILLAATLANLQTGLQLIPSLMLGISNVSEAVVGVLIFNYLIYYKNVYGVHSKVIFAIFSLITSAALSAALGTICLYHFGVLPELLILKNWSTWWTGDMVGTLFIAPFFYKISVGLFQPIKSIEKKYFQFLSLILISVLCNYFVFLNSFGNSFLFLVFVPLLISILWFDSLWIYIVSLATCICAIAATVHGLGPFALYVYDNNYIHLQLFLLALGITAVGLGSLRQEGMHRKAMVALLFGWLMSGLAFYSVFDSNKNTDQSKFVLQSQQAQEAVQSKLNDYIALLDSGVGFFNGSNDVTQKEWHAFTAKIIRNEKFSSVEGLGVILAESEKMTKINSKIVHAVPFAEAANKVIDPENHFIVSYIEPIANKKGLIGLDMATERNRRDAAVRARDTGKPALTYTIHLTLGNGETNALILFNPFYYQGRPLDTVEQRRAAFRGFVYSAIVVNKFFLAALQRSASDIHLTFQFDLDLRSAPASFTSATTAVESKNKIVSKANLAGQPVTFTWRKTKTFEFSSDFVFSMVSFFGAMVTLLLAMMLSTLQSITLTAQTIANYRTKEIIERNLVWKSLTENSPHGIFLANRLGQLTYINPAFSQMTEMNLDEARLLGWTHFIHPDDLESALQLWKDLLSGKNKFEYEFRYILKNNEITYNSVRAMPLVDEKNEITGFLGITQDISDLVKKTNALIASSRLSSLGEMAGGIAHEINNPLSIIMGKATLISQLTDQPHEDPVKVKKFISQINETCQRIAKIIRGLRSFARDTSSEPFQKCRVDEVIQDTLELCHERFTNNGVLLKLPQTIDKSLFFWGRSEQIAQVLLNLLNNAFDAARDSVDKWVEVKIKEDSKKILVMVIDSGSGVKPELRRKIFEPFFTSKVIGQGTGLGLSISRGIMQSHHGNLYLDQEQKNTMFVIEINRFINDAATESEHVG